MQRAIIVVFPLGCWDGWLEVGVRGAPPSVLPDISPTRGEIDLRQGLAHQTGCGFVRRVRPADLPPCGGDARQGRGG
ncbi:conserved hypothetical protein [Agrobacterium deltaense NCPPB 1641]|uniref:Uncharacterized protein n=1 Tax=Agrobacterium deltaense NCPPB 1641 TaxID=1183425 RepID=A0A1S7TMU5_9HYPH|nr:conserved hypothetical protein [Agrobacterium deltaense NCPPB 1641]